MVQLLANDLCLPLGQPAPRPSSGRELSDSFVSSIINSYFVMPKQEHSIWSSRKTQIYSISSKPVLVGVSIAVSTVVPQSIINQLGVSVSAHNRCRVSPSVIVDWQSSVHSRRVTWIAGHWRITLSQSLSVHSVGWPHRGAHRNWNRLGKHRSHVRWLSGDNGQSNGEKGDEDLWNESVSEKLLWNFWILPSF